MTTDPPIEHEHPQKSGSPLLRVVIVVGIIAIGLFGVYRAMQPAVCGGIEEPPKPKTIPNATDQPTYGEWKCKNGKWMITSWGQLGENETEYKP